MKFFAEKYFAWKYFAAVIAALALGSCGFTGVEQAPLPTSTPTPAPTPTLTPTPIPIPIPIPILDHHHPATPDLMEEMDEADEIDKKIAQMSLSEKVGQLFIVRMPSPNRALTLIQDHHIGGFILFGSDVHSIEQLQQLTADLQEASSIPLFIAVDEEGGRVSRVGRLFPDRHPSAFSIGQTADPANAYTAYYTIGRRLSYLGFNMNFAPVADIWTNPANTVIGERAFSTEPEPAAEMVYAAIQGTQSAGIFSVIKHFPGHGDTFEDSHYNMAFYHHDRARFNAVESVPFRRGIEAGTDGIMLGHIAASALSPEYPHIATFCSYLINTVLRQSWGFDGLIITDALDMRGLTNYFTDEEIVINAFLAGSDILLMPNNPERAISALLSAYHDGVIDHVVFHSRLHESLRRILRIKKCANAHFEGGSGLS